MVKCVNLLPSHVNIALIRLRWLKSPVSRYIGHVVYGGYHESGTGSLEQTGQYNTNINTMWAFL